MHCKLQRHSSKPQNDSLIFFLAWQRPSWPEISESGWYVYVSTDGDTWPAESSPSDTVADVNTMQFSPQGERFILSSQEQRSLKHELMV